MSTAIVTAPVEGTTTARGGLTWTVWRVHRAALLVWSAYVLLMVGGMLWLRYVTGAEVRAEEAACRQLENGCIDLESAFGYSLGMSWVDALIAYSSYAVAAWAGASLTGRELERGTAQLAWTQSVTPVRWLTVKLAVPAVALTAGITVLVLVYRWAWSSDRDLRGDEWYYTDPFLTAAPQSWRTPCAHWPSAPWRASPSGGRCPRWPWPSASWSRSARGSTCGTTNCGPPRPSPAPPQAGCR